MSYHKGIARDMKKGVKEEENINNEVLVDIYNAMQEIRYGSVQIHIQDGKIVQIDKLSKIRMR